MFLQCTKKLLDELALKPQKSSNSEHSPAPGQQKPEDQPLFAWHCNLIMLNRRKTVVLVNDSHRYPIILHGLKKADFHRFPELVSEAIRAAMLAEHVDAELVEQYMHRSPGIVLSKTGNRSSVAMMNQLVAVVEHFAEDADPSQLFQPRLNAIAGASLQKFDRFAEHTYRHPVQVMISDFREFFGREVIRCRAAVLRVQLLLERHEVWREMVVPLEIPFERLHKILQLAFSWKNMHLYSFVVYSEEAKPVAEIMDRWDEWHDAHPLDVPMLTGREAMLSDFFPRYNRIVYTYDLGDNWEHEVRLVEVLEEYSAFEPMCRAGAGERPPEDVGGSLGYEEYLHVLNNPTHSDHAWFKEWGTEDLVRPFDLKEVNWRFRDFWRF